MNNCCICGWKGNSFLPRFKDHGRLCVCPNCRSLDRNRHLFFLLNEMILINDDLVLLDIAPSISIMNLLSQICSYVAVDFDPKLQNILPADIRNLPFAPHSFDVILCSHVLEHIENDKIGVKEIFRVLRDGGNALIQVPYKRNASTVEFNETDKHGHVRMYGRDDFISMLTNAGFRVKAESKYNIDSNSSGFDNSEIFICNKPGDGITNQFSGFFNNLNFHLFRRSISKDHVRDIARKPVST